jgi:molybdopterin biosynthesis enzyme
MVRRPDALQPVPLEEARQIFFDALEPAHFFELIEEEIFTREALGRIASRAVFARRNVPHFRSAAMDGIAVRAVTTLHASAQAPASLRLNRDFVYVDTGDPVPEEFDAVVMIEHLQAIGADGVEIRKPARPGQHIRSVGEDFSAGDRILEAGAQITPEAVCALLSTGHSKIWVKQRPRCVFLPTGSELVAPEKVEAKELAPGQLLETNSVLFESYVRRWGGQAHLAPIIGDRALALSEAFESALDNFDLVAIGSGTSRGRDDRTAALVREYGRVLVHGVAYHPGHPVLLGIARGKPVIGVPGYPVAAWVCLFQFVQPLLERYAGLAAEERPAVTGVLTREIKSVRGYREFVRVCLEKTAAGYRVHPLPGGASRISSILRADGWIEVPEDIECIQAGQSVRVQTLR